MAFSRRRLPTKHQGHTYMIVVSFALRCREGTVSETMSMLTCFAILVEKKRFTALFEYLSRTSLTLSNSKEITGFWWDLEVQGEITNSETCRRRSRDSDSVSSREFVHFRCG